MPTPVLAANQTSAFDATPDPTGKTLYFTGLAGSGAPLAGVYSAPADGSVPTPTVVTAGAPYVSPWGISTSTDGMTLYIADPGADIVLDSGGNQINPGVTPSTDLGEIFVQAVSGGAPTALLGSAGWEPRGVEVIASGSSDLVYFTGRNPTSGKVGVYTLPAGGASTPTTILEGAPLVDPSGIAVGKDGTVFVADGLGSASGLGQVVTIKSGTGTQLLGDIRIGFPSGIAVSLDETQLFLSTLDPVTATDVLLQVVIATPATMTPITTNVATNTEAAGLHRARNVNVFAWADSTAGASGGTVYTAK